MRTIQEYVELVKERYKQDTEELGYSLQECVDLVVDKAFFEDEITYPIVEPLKQRILKELKNV